MAAKITEKYRDGYYDEEGRWQRTKHCFIYCGPEKCTCGPPMGLYKIEPKDKSSSMEEGTYGGFIGE